MREETARRLEILKNVLVMYFIFGSNNISTKVEVHSGYSCKVKTYGTWFDSLQTLFFHKNYSDAPKKAGLIRTNLSELFNIYIY